MGRRSRKRGGTAPPPTTRAERDVARAAPRPRPTRGGRPSRERPAAPWGSFPLSELIILAGIVVLFWGLLSGGDAGGRKVAAGLILCSLGGGELALREHLGGFRSHSALLAGVATFVVVTVIVLTLGPLQMWVVLIAGVAVFGASFFWMRDLFRRRSGGLSFR